MIAFRWITVYVRSGENWQFAASQATRLAEVRPKGRAELDATFRT
jgi:hypothetical protein